MIKKAFLAIAALLAVCPLLAAPLPDAAKAIAEGKWYLSLSPGARDQVRFFAIEPSDIKRLFLRRFATPSFYLDALAGDDLKILLWPSVKAQRLSFAKDGLSFRREPSSVSVEYKRETEARTGAKSGYEGDWDIGDPAMTVSIRACEDRPWSLVMYFPGDPYSAIPMGYYPLAIATNGGLSSSSAYGDSLIEVEYEPATDALIIRPMFTDRPLADELYDPVRAWRDK